MTNITPVNWNLDAKQSMPNEVTIPAHWQILCTSRNELNPISNTVKAVQSLNICSKRNVYGTVRYGTV